MRIMYFGENKEEGTERVAVIRFTDDEFDLYKYIKNYEHTYGDNTREFGALIGIERNEKGVWINECYISVDNFTDFNDLKANYKEAKKEFKSLKKLATETNPETATDPETTVAETATETNPETAIVPETTVAETATETNPETAIVPETTEAETATEKELEKLEKELIETEETHIDDIEKFKEKSTINSLYGISSANETKELLAVEQFERLTRALYKTLFKAIGLTETRKIHFIISNNMVFFNYNGTQYKYYPSQCKIFKKCGRKYQRINWKNFADENNQDGQKQNRGRSPPLLLI